jgi:hypothetical protein
MKLDRQLIQELAYYTMNADNENYDKVMVELERNTYKYKDKEEETK